MLIGRKSFEGRTDQGAPWKKGYIFECRVRYSIGNQYSQGSGTNLAIVHSIPLPMTFSDTISCE